MLSRQRARRTALVVLLETVPPTFHLVLIFALAYHILLLHPTSSGWRVATSFVVAQILLNWLQFVRRKSVVSTSAKNFPGYVHRFPKLTSSRDVREIDNDYEATRSSWKECDACDMYVPLLSHHCSLCRKCIYALDHHCYFLGHCVGRANQKHFIVFCLYAALGSVMAVYSIGDEMAKHRTFLSVEIFYFLLPFTTLMYFFNDAESFEVLYACLLDLGVGSAAFCTLLFVWSAKKVLWGDPRHEEVRKRATRHEFTRTVRIRYDDEKETTKWERFRNVFGSCGLFYFLFPFVPVSSGPVVEAGHRRIVTYNSDYVLNGMIHTGEEEEQELLG